MKIGFFGLIVILLINLTIGAWSIVEILSWFGKSVPMVANVAIGLFLGEFSIPLAIVGKILKVCGVF